MVVRSLIVLAVKQANTDLLPYYGLLLGLIPAIGFSYIYLTGSRKTGPEVFGEKIWWNDLRPVHAAFHFAFAFMAFYKQSYSYVPLLMDVVIGTVAFMLFHFS